MSWFDRNRQHQDWRNATWAERQLRDLLLRITAQNEVILAAIEKRAPKLSPEDQAAVDEIFAIEVSDRKKIDTQLAKK